MQAIMPAESQESSRRSSDKKTFRINAKDASNRDLVTRQVSLHQNLCYDTNLNISMFVRKESLAYCLEFI